MGINIAYLPFFDLVHTKNPLNGDMAALGSQEMHDTKKTLKEFAATHNYPNFTKDFSVRGLFKDRYNISSYVDYDINDSADVKIDMGKPVPKNLYNSCDIILNAGTAEHIFNISCVFENMHNMLRVGGIFFNIVPYTWHIHGFYNLDPILFYSLDAANKYRRIAEAFYLPKVKNIFSSKYKLNGLQIARIGENYTKEAADIHYELDNLNARRNILFFYATIKQNDTPFNIPYDIQP